jgi:hypothetical protein
MLATTVNRERPTPSSVQAFASRNLQLLSAIENTVDSLAADCKIIHTLCDDMSILSQLISQSASETMIDPEGRAGEILVHCAATLRRIPVYAAKRRQSAAEDKQLTAEDGVVDAYDAYVSAIERFRDVVIDLREIIATHDALLEKPGERIYKSADELFEALGIAA